MPKKEETPRQRMVVEEVGSSVAPEVVQEPVEELKEKVEELSTITEGISESAEKSSQIQDQIVEAAEKVIPAQIPESQATVPPYSQVESGPSPLAIILPGILLLGALLGGIFFYQKQLAVTSSETPIPAVDSNLTADATPTPQVQVDLTKYKISILNGGGTAGEAGKAKTLLETAGFTVSGTANAKDYSFTKTIISAKSTVDKAFLDALSEALAKTYVVGTNEMIASSSADSVVVTIGSSKK